MPTGTGHDKLMPDVLTLQQAVERIPANYWALRRAIKSGKIRTIRPFGRDLIPMTEINRILGISPPE